MNVMVVESKALQDQFETSVLRLSYAKENQDLGKVRLQKIFRLVGYFFRLAKLLFINRPDLVYFQISTSGNALIRDALFVALIKMLRVPLVYHVHAMDISSGFATWRRPIYSFAFRKSHMIHLTSKSAQDIPADFQAKVQVLPNTIADRDVRKTDIGDRLNLIFISNLMIEKGLYDLLEIASHLKSEKVNFHLNVIGKEHEVTMSEIQSRIHDLDLGDFIDVPGPKYGNDKYDYLDQSDILVFPTFYHKEVFPLVVLEAMQAGLPVVSYEHAGIPEIIKNEEQGFLVPSRDISAFASRIMQLDRDRALLKRMGTEAQQKFEQQFNRANFDAGLVEILSRLVHS